MSGFTLAADDAAWWWPVDVHVPVDGGETRVEQFDCQFRLLSRSRQKALATRPNVEFLRAIIVDFRGIQTPDGDALVCCPETIETLAEIPYAARSISEAYTRFALGIAEKNSETPPSAGGIAALKAAVEGHPTPS